MPSAGSAKLKILFLVQKDQRIILDRLYESVAARTECDLRWLDSGEQANLRRYFDANIETGRYARVVLFLRFKKELRQRLFMRGLSNLVLLEHDAWQNYFPGKYRGKFSAHYRQLPAARVLCSGFQVAEKLRAEGVDAVFVPKGYDQALLANRGRARDIALGFVGSVGNDAYRRRRAMLDAIRARAPLTVTRTASGTEYADALNRIRFFISADVGMGEYMVKNFEAMACGCVLCAWDQGEAENRALGFRDMENLVLYRDVDELLAKLSALRAAPERADAIAAAGQALAERAYSFARLGARIAEALVPPLRLNSAPGFLERMRMGLRL
jgi:glycosyltransferase involved in cell wall biosynthesis